MDDHPARDLLHHASLCVCACRTAALIGRRDPQPRPSCQPVTQVGDVFNLHATGASTEARLLVARCLAEFEP